MTEFPTKLFFVFNAMAAKLCKEKQTSFGNNMKYSDFIDGKYLGGGELAHKRNPLFKGNRF